MKHFSAFLVLIFHTLLALLIFTSSVKPTYASRSTIVPSKSSTIEFIRAHCHTTTYPLVCFQSLSSFAQTIRTSPKQLAYTALSVSLYGAKSTATMMARLSTIHGVRSREAGALQDCLENIGNSIDELQQSLDQMGHLQGPDYDYKMNNMQTWVSAALTDEDTCLDGFAGQAMNGKIKNIVRGRIVNVAQLTSNALALINGLASVRSQSP